MREHVNVILDVRTTATALACRAPLRAAVFALAFTVAPAVHAEAPTPLRILSWNVWGLPAASTNLEPRMAALPDAIAKLDPDVILLQEVWAESDGVALKRGLARHGYRYASHLAHTGQRRDQDDRAQSRQLPSCRGMVGSRGRAPRGGVATLEGQAKPPVPPRRIGRPSACRGFCDGRHLPGPTVKLYMIDTRLTLIP